MIEELRTKLSSIEKQIEELEIQRKQIKLEVEEYNKPENTIKRILENSGLYASVKIQSLRESYNGEFFYEVHFTRTSKSGTDVMDPDVVRPLQRAGYIAVVVNPTYMWIAKL